MLSFSVALATFQGLSEHRWPVATTWDSDYVVHCVPAPRSTRDECHPKAYPRLSGLQAGGTFPAAFSVIGSIYSLKFSFLLAYELNFHSHWSSNS